MSKYKAVISDIDGTLTPITPHAMPTKKVRLAIGNVISKGINFSFATGRTFALIDYLVPLLNIKSPIIIDNGAVICKPDGSVLWEALLPSDEAEKILPFIKGLKFTRLSCQDGAIDNPLSVPKNSKIRKISVHDVSVKQAETLIKKIETAFKDLAIVRAASYEGDNFMDVYISNGQATKQHAVLKYAQLLGISTDEIIGIGDGHNDFPLLMACGLKVAMGNAVEELKAIADEIAPAVDDDGLAYILEKYF